LIGLWSASAKNNSAGSLGVKYSFTVITIGISLPGSIFIIEK